MQLKQLRGEFLAMNTYFSKEEESQVSNRSVHFKVEKEKQMKWELFWRNNILEIKKEINETEKQ